MKFTETLIAGVFLIENEIIEDERGAFSRLYCSNEAKTYLGEIRWVQVNQSFNHKKGTFRGMHYQIQPHAEEKMIKCTSGKIIDIVLDLRKNSPTFLKSLQFELSPEKRNMIFIPKGVAHGFQTLVDNTELLYHHSAFYNKEADRGIRYNDPLVNISLPIEISTISNKDLNYTLLEPNFKGLEI